MPDQDTATPPAAPMSPQTDRRRVVRLVASAETARAGGGSVRAVAAGAGVPSSTLYYWLARKDRIDAPEAERDFFESPDGLAVLHQIVAAAHLVFVQAGGCGSDRVSQFLRLSRLDRFVGASHGIQHALASQMETLLGEYGDVQQARMGLTMAPKTITVCEDETFHPDPCLVAIDALSDFIVLEGYSQQRDGATWTERLTSALAGLRVRVVQVVSDEAKGLLAHARSGLGVHHGPDLFHLLRELSKATSLPLAARLEKPWTALERAIEASANLREAKAAYWRGPRSPGRPPAFDQHIAAAEARVAQARDAYDALVKDREDVRAAIRAISAAYHPFDLATGAVRSAEAVAGLVGAAFAAIDTVAERARLAERCRERIEKARRVAPKLVATVAFFHVQLDLALADLALSPATLEVVRTQLLPGLYLAQAARRAQPADTRNAIRSVSQTLLANARAPTSPLSALDDTARRQVEAVALACVELFVRSSACVEGRNGQLALLHHSLHRLSKRRLKALTVIHNYYNRRPDGSTAAERFFAQKPDDLFAWLLDRLDVPVRPRAARAMAAA